MKKVLFIDRDGTLIVEPPDDYQVDSLEKLAFIPESIVYLSRIAKELDFELVMVTNQDGLGTDTFPESTFWPAHNMMVKTLEDQGITFTEILIDRSRPEDGLPTRKPGTGLLHRYIYGNYDLASSYVIGDRGSDIELAQNLGCKAIKIGEPDTRATLSTESWKDIYLFLKGQPRTATYRRTTKETDIAISINLDGIGASNISTGLSFLDHMLEQIAKHASIDLDIKIDGDLQVDEHHTVEDTAIALGEVTLQALGSKRGIERYGFLLPMDDCLAQVAIDFGGRPWLVWDAAFKREYVGDVPTELFFHFFKSFSDAAKCNLNIQASGGNEHHKIEAIFKATAKAIKMAVALTNGHNLPTTKGQL